jgi:biofilm PGA synthesis N-glycosyltransferase PgaC
MSLFLNFFPILTWVLFIVVFLFYACYLIVLAYFNRRHNLTKNTSEFTYPTISIVVPVYNEEKVIAKKIQNIEEIVCPNDKIEVIFVDGQSTDRTSEIIVDEAHRCQKSVRLIKQEQRDGYTNAVIRGILNSKGEIIVAMDAASYHYPDAMEHLVKHFADPKIGAVTGKEVVLGNDKQLGPQLEKSYRFFYDLMRKAETEMDSTPDSKGEILAVRREICIDIIPKLKRSINASFDSCVPYQAKLMGYRTIYDEQAKYYEYAPASFSERMKVQIRRATVLIGAMFMFKSMLFNKKFGKFGLLILPDHFIMCCLLPSIFILGFVSLAISTVVDPVYVVPIWLLLALGMIVSGKSRTFLVSFTQSQFALFIALFRLAGRRQSLFIESVQSTRAQK